MACPSEWAIFSETPQFTSIAAKSSANTFPENIPVRIPITVMPICMVDRNRSGSSASFRAVFAVLLPLFISLERLDFRAETRAISDMARIPFSSIRIKIIISSFISY